MLGARAKMGKHSTPITMLKHENKRKSEHTSSKRQSLFRLHSHVWELGLNSRNLNPLPADIPQSHFSSYISLNSKIRL